MLPSSWRLYTYLGSRRITSSSFIADFHFLVIFLRGFLVLLFLFDVFQEFLHPGVKRVIPVFQSIKARIELVKLFVDGIVF